MYWGGTAGEGVSSLGCHSCGSKGIMLGQAPGGSVAGKEVDVHGWHVVACLVVVHCMESFVVLCVQMTCIFWVGLESILISRMQLMASNSSGCVEICPLIVVSLL